ncbi:MAG: hypothetical protein EOM54_07905 [Clostridia bacterium]|nr:hypothetical protein [Clostridia bacterium]
MTGLLREWVLGLCGSAVVCALALAVCPKGRVNGVLRVICGAVMTIALLAPVVGLDFEVYSESLEKYRVAADETAGSASKSEDILTRTIIEDECAAYILDKAVKLGLSMSCVRVSARWSEEGFWYPYEAVLQALGTQEKKTELAEIVASDLGIPRDRQYWEEDAE